LIDLFLIAVRPASSISAIFRKNENKFNNIQKPYRKQRGGGPTGKRLLTATGKVWRNWVWTNNL